MISSPDFAARPVVILGFGRSGTTWISDIVSKACGGLVLFEPLHPSVTEQSAHLSYGPVGDAAAMAAYLDGVLGKRHRRPWLMRNHVPVPLADIDPAFLELLWNECQIAGFKEIRANAMIPWLHARFGHRVVFIVRDPRAVVASILKRRNFWEFGWPGTYETLVARTIDNPALAATGIARFRPVLETVRTDAERIAAMWAITHAVALPDLAARGLPVFRYEDFYTDPFGATRALFSHLGWPGVRLHPAYIFTPSMTTAKTLHGLYEFDARIARHDLDFFWNGILDDDAIRAVGRIVRAFEIDLYEIYHRPPRSCREAGGPLDGNTPGDHRG